MAEKIILTILGAFLLFILLFLGVIGYVFMDNSAVKTTSYSVYSERLPKIFDGYKIALITDFHNSNNVDKVVEKVAGIHPQVILCVGDMINKDDKTFENTDRLMKEFVKIAPTYFSSGNHETWSVKEKDFLSAVEKDGVTVLNNKVVQLDYKGSKINLAGYKDIIYSDNAMRMNILKKELKTLYEKIPDKNLFNLLMFHRANYFDTVAEYPFDLVLSGHLHGGQVNLPGLREELLKAAVGTAKYSRGYYRIGTSQMIVGAGLEKNMKRLRVFNTPEVVAVTLKRFE